MKPTRIFAGLIAALALCSSLTACFPGADTVPQPTNTSVYVPAPGPTDATLTPVAPDEASENEEATSED